MEEENATSGQPLSMLSALPVFFLVWWKAGEAFGPIYGLIYALIAAFGTMALTYAIFVWIPDDQARKLNRKQRFAKSKQLIVTNRKLIAKVQNDSVKKNMKSAIDIFEGLTRNLELKNSYQGIIEDKLVSSLEDCFQETTEWIGGETGEFPLDKTRRDELFAILTHKDDLFLLWQQNGIDKTSFLTATFRSKMEMESAGINLNEGEK